MLLSYNKGSLETFTVAIISGYYLFFEWFAKCREDFDAIIFSLIVEFFLLANLLIDWASYSFSHNVSMDYMIAYASITSLMHFYTVAWELFDAMKNCGAWALRCSVFNVCLSIGWVMASPLFAENPQKIALTQHRFDLMLSLFVLLVVFLMDKIKEKAERAAAFITWFLPFELLWYSTQVKIMVYCNFGSPYHPSWVARGLVKGYYSYNAAADLTYGIATVLMTVMATFSGAIVIIRNVEFKGWGILSVNGIMLVVFSALYMLAAVTGPFPKMVPTGIMSLLEVKPFIPLQPHQLVDAINTHVRDLILGLMCIMAGLGLDLLAKDKSNDFKARSEAICALISITWILFVVPKLYLHLADHALV